MLYIDIIGAFAAVARRISIPGLPESEEAWKRHLRDSHFTDQQANDIVNMALSVLNWTDAGCSDHALALLRATHSCTWFSVDGIAGISACISGALAGTSLADVIFIISINSVIIVIIFIIIIIISIVIIIFQHHQSV